MTTTTLETIPLAELEAIAKSVMYPRRRPLWRSILYSRNHWRCLLFTLLIHLCISLITWCQISRYSATRSIPITRSPVTASLQERRVSANESMPHYENPSSAALQQQQPNQVYVDEDQLSNVCRTGYFYVPMVFLVLMYLVYVIEFWNCPLRVHILAAASTEQTYALFQRLRDSSPRVWWRVSCYHYLRRSTKAASSDMRHSGRYAAGRYHTQYYHERLPANSTTYCYEKTITYTASTEYKPHHRRHQQHLGLAGLEVPTGLPHQSPHPLMFSEDEEVEEQEEQLADLMDPLRRQDVTLMNHQPIASQEPPRYWIDVTRQVEGLEDFTLTEVTFSKAFSFQCEEDERRYNYQRLAFYAAHEAVDDFMETREGLELDGVSLPNQPMLVTPHPKHQLPFYIRSSVFVWCSFLLASWPLRILILYKMAHLHLHVHKCFCSDTQTTTNNSRQSRTTRQNQHCGGINGTSPGFLSPVHTAWWNSLSTPPITEIPPSYSEALRLCDLRGRQHKPMHFRRRSRQSRNAVNNEGLVLANNVEPISADFREENESGRPTPNGILYFPPHHRQRRSHSCNSLYSNCSTELQENFIWSIAREDMKESERNTQQHAGELSQEQNTTGTTAVAPEATDKPAAEVHNPLQTTLVLENYVLTRIEPHDYE